MSGPDPEDEIEYLTEQVRTALADRSDVVSFAVEPGEPTGVIVRVETADDTEYYRVTLEHRPGGEENVHWELLGEEFDL